jgi:hypothetical protein
MIALALLLVTSADGDYELATRLAALELPVAAAEYYYNVAHDRTQPELLAASLEALRVIMAGPHDEYLLEKGLLAENELGRFPSELDAFISYTKGLEDLRAHRLEWAERHFAAIDVSATFKADAYYALGVQRLRRGARAEGVQLLRKALPHREAQLALARILFEDRRYEAALQLYLRIERSEPTLYLELAWTQFHLGRLEEAMGSLHALDAPEHRNFFAPEVFVLRALIYKELCHYVPAKRVIREFRQKYERILANIHARAEDASLRAAALERGQLKRLAAFRSAIADERARAAELEDRALAEQLEHIYAVKERQVERNIAAMIDEQLREVAEELIDLEEQMELLDYELGLAIHQRARTPLGRREPRATDANSASFVFRGEYWNDELEDYRLVLADRCVRKEGLE